jgi:hypothetical protein
MSFIKTYYRNLLENSTVTSTPTEEATYPVYHLYDRKIGRNYKPSASGTVTLLVDQGATTQYEADAIIIPSGHNLSGETLTLASSSDNATYTTVKTITPDDSGDIYETFTAQTKRYWKLTITTPKAIPSFAELYLSDSYAWERNPIEIDRGNYPVFNVLRMEDSGGRPRFVEMGDKRDIRTYSLEYASSAQRVETTTLNNAWAGKNPFYFLDTDGTTLIFVELTSPLEFKRNGDYASFDFNIMEVLP